MSTVSPNLRAPDANTLVKAKPLRGVGDPTSRAVAENRTPFGAMEGAPSAKNHGASSTGTPSNDFSSPREA
jgi:hypothetical protein